MFYFSVKYLSTVLEPKKLIDLEFLPMVVNSWDNYFSFPKPLQVSILISWSFRYCWINPNTWLYTSSKTTVLNEKETFLSSCGTISEMASNTIVSLYFFDFLIKYNLKSKVIVFFFHSAFTIFSWESKLNWMGSQWLMPRMLSLICPGTEIFFTSDDSCTLCSFYILSYWALILLILLYRKYPFYWFENFANTV